MSILPEEHDSKSNFSISKDKDKDKSKEITSYRLPEESPISNGFNLTLIDVDDPFDTVKIKPITAITSPTASIHSTIPVGCKVNKPFYIRTKKRRPFENYLASKAA